MQNYFSIETEVAFRRWELEREIEAAEQHARARPKNGRKRWSHLAALSLESLRSLATPWVPVTCWNVRAPRATTLEGGGATAT